MNKNEKSSESKKEYLLALALSSVISLVVILPVSYFFLPLQELLLKLTFSDWVMIISLRLFYNMAFAVSKDLAGALRGKET